uniref:Serine/threonine protein phosphatase 2A regulatory subunit n=1 Tax=Aplanochytrium stocchinoi TaxID=215587 RepID=A0A6S8EAE1_9STRA|mmetsp:Transcript_216/g.319  ORF Transcript_216/g.319 Transcript_216/m.319 type:complete len:700 (+) Transcript_216:303-2402(+)|eukprot:CAMPEP_0204872340 /NCGR_PEP_ID=MMETSP1348-20121228/37932_1 /ASSEMBLY_ACC=CAM_ASM_000700 /TAXON_ID=215587 /ORGANISM="Aplanochytrium stocchinoi, Strain GSBS06" /LENGTH=699 /DNA_ID=CAMNT_0052027145 /DNA_START=284 /DNA_END=2383 /DNA_ORIENTATION=+
MDDFKRSIKAVKKKLTNQGLLGGKATTGTDHSHIFSADSTQSEAGSKDMSDPKNKQKAKSKHKRLGIFSTTSSSTANDLSTSSPGGTGDVKLDIGRSDSENLKEKGKNGISLGSKHKKPKRVTQSQPSSPLSGSPVQTQAHANFHTCTQEQANVNVSMDDDSDAKMRICVSGNMNMDKQSKGTETPRSKEVLIQTGAVGSPYLDVGMQRVSPNMMDMMEIFKGLPMLGEANNPSEQTELFRYKLQLCKIVFDFDKNEENSTSTLQNGPHSSTELLYGKELKRKTLLELVEYVNSERGQKIFAAVNMMEEVIDMVSINIFRPLPPQEDEYDPEEDDPVLETAWPHLQVVYEFLLRFVMSKEVPSKTAKRKGVIDQKFCLRLIHMFDSEDPRERDYLKTILHRVYGKFMSHRQFIRTQIGYTFQRFVYETQRHNGISELLEILGSIINGFVLPLKEEHQSFLRTSLIPLHKPKMVALYHQQLNYCIVQYTDKDRSTCVPIMNGLYKYWPWTHSSKQVMFLNEVEEILDSVVPDFVEEMRPALLRILNKSIKSEHFQVVERTLYLWNNNHIVTHCFANDQAKYVLPAIFSPLKRKLKEHWNPTVMNLADEVAHLYRIVDGSLWKQLESTHKLRNETKLRIAQRRKHIWTKLKSGVPPSKLDFENNLLVKDPSTDGDYTDEEDMMYHGSTDTLQNFQNPMDTS